MKHSLILLLVPAFVTAAEPKTPEKILKLFVSELVKITPGKGKFPATFQMGSTKGDANEKPVHRVKLTKPFSMAKYEVTQELYQVVMGVNPSRWKGPRNSVEMMTWAQANEFCKKITQMLRKQKLIGAKQVIRLPSEAEWDYCCRAGTTTPFSFGQAKDIQEYAWHRGNSKGFDPPVGQKKPNPWGLYDMHGYIWEWVADSYHPNYKGAPTDGSAWQSKTAKEYVVRGGAWNVFPAQCRSATRGHRDSKFKSQAVGFRCVLE